MKVALVHELLTMRGGAERVLRVFARMFPDAPIYTLLYDEALLGEWFPPERVRVSSVQKFSTFSTNHHWYIGRFPEAVEAWDFSEFDLVLSSSSAFAHGIITNGKPRHLSYIHAPARYLWDRTHDIISRAPWYTRAYLSRLFHRLRVWDSEAADRADALVAASEDARRRVELYWRRNADVIHPPIDNFWMETAEPIRNSQFAIRNYFLIVSTLASYKRIDLAIEACNNGNLPLKIVGAGRAESSLKRMAGPTIEFLGYKDQKELRSLYAGATALIVPGEEDFGLVALEAMSQGTPVIALRAGGPLETVTDGITGTFFDEQTPDSLLQVLKTFDHKKYSSEKCISASQKFSESEFEHKMRAKIDELMKTHF